MPETNWTAEQIEGILDEGNVVFVLQERDQPSKYLKAVEVRQRTADELGVFLEIDGIEESEDFIKCRDALATAVNWLKGSETGPRIDPPPAVVEWLDKRLLAATEIADKMPASERQAEPPGIVAMAQLRNDNLKLRRTINIVSKAINRAIPGLAISGIKDEEAIRIWNECSK